jgi:chromosome segregation ATPase
LEAATEFRIMTVRTEELKSRTTLAEAFASIVADSEKKITERIGGLEREASESKAKILELEAEASESKAKTLELEAETSEIKAKILKLQAQSSEIKAATTSLQESLEEFRQEDRKKIREIKERMERESAARAAETLALQDKIKQLAEEEACRAAGGQHQEGGICMCLFFSEPGITKLILTSWSTRWFRSGDASFWMRPEKRFTNYSRRPHGPTYC